MSKKRNVILNCGSGLRYSVLQIVKAFEKKINIKFRISYKITNFDETQTICSNIELLRSLLKTNIEKKDIKDLIKDYL